MSPEEKEQKRIDELIAQRLSEDKLNPDKDLKIESSSDEVFVPNVYLAPRIIAMYWRPALNGSEVKVLEYLIYKTFAFGKDKAVNSNLKEEGDYIAFSQLLDGIEVDYEDIVEGKKVKKKVRYDYGAGVRNKKSLRDALVVLEQLKLIEVTRSFDETRRVKNTNKYRLTVHHRYEVMEVSDRKEYMLDNPFRKVKIVRDVLREQGKISTQD